jgi:hypothetical protein
MLIGKQEVGQMPSQCIEHEGKLAAAVKLGRLGGRARVKAISARRRKEIAKKAAKSQWKRSQGTFRSGP